ncbi:hypothetical protein, conserved [Leishmania tarentolae]|uniref:Ankyrin repeat protein n=1 Tax=Leishmania tarentolae TaxID=5689 RepID=A0A640KPN3_LEITA|nr:hypothetical protein, conserved [Leishmania tarentolae]
MNSDASPAFSYVLELLLSPLEEPFRRYLEICEDVHMCDVNRNTMLHWAATVGNFAAAYALLQHGVDVDARNVYGATPLHLAAAFAPNMGVMGPLLMKHGASLTAKVSCRNAAGVESLLTSRGLNAVWRWLCELNALLKQNDATSPLLFQFSGSLSLPSAATIKATTSLLCAPEELQKLMQDRVNGKARSRATADMLDVPIPRAPAKRLTPHVCGTQVLMQKRLLRPAPSQIAGEELTSCSINTPLVSLRSEREEREADVALYISREETERIRVEKEEMEARLDIYVSLRTPLWSSYACDERVEVDIGSKMPASAARLGSAGVEGNAEGADAYAGLVGCIVTVLGEKYDEKGGRQLFVQYNEPGGVDDARLSEAWCPFSSVAGDPVVVAYVDRYNRTHGLTNSISEVSAVIPLILIGEGPSGSPLDTMEREQLEEQLRMLPRRDLSSPESAYSVTVSTKQLATASTSGLKSLDVSSTARDGKTPSVPSFPNPPTTASAYFFSSADACWDEKDGASSHFAQADMQDVSPVQGMRQSTALAAPTKLRCSSEGMEAVQDTGTSVLASHAPAIGHSRANQNDAAVYLLQHSSVNMNRGTSSASPMVLTHPQASSLRESPRGILEKDERYYLSEMQKTQYNGFLRDSALQRLQKRQGHFFSSVSGG